MALGKGRHSERLDVTQLQGHRPFEDPIICPHHEVTKLNTHVSGKDVPHE